MFFDDQGRLRSLLASWTDVVEPDAFAECSAGRSWPLCIALHNGHYA
jgi:hypothetical protein